MMLRRYKLVWVPVVAAVGAAIWILFLHGLPPAEAHTRITTDITWSEDIRAIFQKKCMPCHHKGGLAPEYVDFTVYGTDVVPGARAWAVAIEEEIETGRMPPWQGDPRFGAFSNSRMLTPEEREYIIGWVQGGAPQGPRRDLPVPEEFSTPDWAFGEPDFVAEPTTPFSFGAENSGSGGSFVVPGPVDEDKWITGFEFRPEHPQDTFSLTAWIIDEAIEDSPSIEVEVQVPYDPLAPELVKEPTRLRPMPRGRHFLGQWVRGDTPVLLPDAGGRKLRKGAIIEVEVYYERAPFADSSIEIVDSPRLGLFFAGPREEIDLLVESRSFSAESQEKDSSQAVLVFDENVHLVGLHPQFVDTGRKLEARLQYPDGLSTTLLWVPKFERRWTSSYFFERPIAAPAGSRLEVVSTHDGDPESGALEAIVDYTLDDHLIVQRPFDPLKAAAAQPGGGMTAVGRMIASQPGITLTPEPDVAAPAVDTAVADASADKDIYWCPMRGNPCEVKDFHGPGKCDECEMDLRPRATFFEDRQIAPQTTTWDITDTGYERVYWCPNRGGEDHILLDYSAPGACPVCAEPLLHKAQFSVKHTWTCITQTCSLAKSLFYGPGLCPECGQPAQGMGHMDHTPVHGGWQFFMADNLYHHIEGTMPAKGAFRMYFYDDWKTPLDPRNFAGTVIIEHEDAATGNVTEEAIPLAHAEGTEYLNAALPNTLPLAFYTKVWLAGVETRFDFEFEELTVEPPKESRSADVRLHSHRRDPLDLPPTIEGILREIGKRDAALKALIETKDWFGVHYPAFDAKDLMAGLADKQDGLNMRQRGQLKTAIGLVNRGANALDRAGDTGDEARVTQAYDTFAEGIAALATIYPKDGAAQ